MPAALNFLICRRAPSKFRLICSWRARIGARPDIMAGFNVACRSARRIAVLEGSASRSAASCCRPAWRGRRRARAAKEIARTLEEVRKNNQGVSSPACRAQCRGEARRPDGGHVIKRPDLGVMAQASRLLASEAGPHLSSAKRGRRREVLAGGIVKPASANCLPACASHLRLKCMLIKKLKPIHLNEWRPSPYECRRNSGSGRARREHQCVVKIAAGEGEMKWKPTFSPLNGRGRGMAGMSYRTARAAPHIASLGGKHAHGERAPARLIAAFGECWWLRPRAGALKHLHFKS